MKTIIYQICMQQCSWLASMSFFQYSPDSNRTDIIDIQMGNQCCVQDGINRQFRVKSLNSAGPDQSDKERMGLEAVGKAYEFIQHFQPVEKTPKLHPTVQKLEDQLGTFNPNPIILADIQGQPESQAYAINNSGLVYDKGSEWSEGMPHGLGRLIYPDGSLYIGTFIKGVPSGQGRFVSNQGWYYEGDLVKEQAEGLGTFAFEAVGYRYEGQWQGDLPNGKGKQEWKKGDKKASYEGEFTAGVKNGMGTYVFGDEWQYTGPFSNNEITGSKGKMRYRNREVYEGDFVNGKKHGYGVYRWQDGSVFEGWYIDDKKQGHGKYRTVDNKMFEGEWKDGMREGRGVLSVGGKKYPGEWLHDVPVTPKKSP